MFSQHEAGTKIGFCSDASGLPSVIITGVTQLFLSNQKNKNGK